MQQHLTGKIARRNLLASVGGLAASGMFIGGISARAEAPGSWSIKAPLPVPRFGLHSGVVDGKIYVTGGTTNETDAVSMATMHVYDPAADHWTAVTDMPTARGFFGTAVNSRRLHAIGGSLNMQEQDPGIGMHEVYDPGTDSWTRAADMPTPRADLTANAVGGKIYAIGGTRHVGIEALGMVEEYDAESDTWTRKADMPTPRLHLSSAVIDDKIYVVGGGSEWPVPLAANEMYDPAMDTWTKMADMPTPRVGVWAAALRGKLYVLGGLSWENSALKVVEEFDPKTNTWRKVAEMPTARFLLTAEAVDDRVFAIGGASTEFITHDTVEAFILSR
jgi:N-acetylneuraminic acid mutarotase